MKTISENDFYKLKSVGMLYVLLPESLNFDGTYESYIKELRLNEAATPPEHDPTNSLAGCGFYEENNPEPLLPRKRFISHRIGDIAEVVFRYSNVEESIPNAWLEELWELNNELEILNREKGAVNA